MAAEHPSYRNPTIVEAICEIHFVSGAEPVWSSSRPMPLYKVIEAEFPEMEIIPEANVTFELSDDGPRQSVQPTGQRLRFKSADGTRLIQIPSSGDVVVFNVLKPYPGWAAVKAMISEHWGSLSPLLQPQALIRVGLRYINKVRHSEAAPATSNWLQPTESIPSIMISSDAGSSSRVEATLGSGHRMAQIVQSLPPSPTEMYGATVIDSDHVWMDAGGCEPGALLEVLDNLHDAVWKSFSTALTPHYVIHLEGQGGEKTDEK